MPATYIPGHTSHTKVIVSKIEHKVHRDISVPRKSSFRAYSDQQELSVCTNKTCKRQGSLQIARYVEDLGLPGLAVQRTGCLGKCGSGPNMVLSPLGVQLSHINTIAKVTEVLRSVGGYEVPESLLKATELRLAGNVEARSGNSEQAVELYSRALELDPPIGKHLLLSNRSGVLLSLGRSKDAARDADEAASLAPAGFRNAYIRQAEAHSANGDYEAVAQALEKAVARDPDFTRTEEYRSLSTQLGKYLARQ